MTQEPTICGTITFKESLLCSANALGKTYDISIGGHAGTLTLPSLPNWEELDGDSFNIPLTAPARGQQWKIGERLLNWGRVVSTPDGDSEVKIVLIEFPLHPDIVESGSDQIYKKFVEWLDLFEKYVTLFTAQNTGRSGISISRQSDEIELHKSDTFEIIHINGFLGMFEFSVRNKDEFLNLEQLTQALSFSSQLLSPRLEYQLLLESYNARKNKDYRKAIIEAATGLEICLTNLIKEEFKKQNFSTSLSEKLLKKFRMLGGRLELVNVLGISLPRSKNDYEKLVSNPRNDVIHKADFANKAIAYQVIDTFEEILKKCSPKYHEDKP